MIEEPNTQEIKSSISDRLDTMHRNETLKLEICDLIYKSVKHTIESSNYIKTNMIALYPTYKK